MTDVTILMLRSGAADADSRFAAWWRFADNRLVASGSGGDGPNAEPGDRIIALAPAADAPVRWHDLPGLTPLQAATAARLQVAELLVGDAGTNHIAAGQPDADGTVPTSAVARQTMAQWQDQLAAADLRVDAIVPIAAVIPVPAAGMALRLEVAGQSMLRVEGLAAEADPAIDMLRLGEHRLVDASSDEAERWLAALADQIPLNLLTGDFALQAPSAMTPVIKRWLVRLTAALLLVSLGVPLVQHWQRARAADAAEAGALTAAKKVGVTGKDAAGVEAQLDQRLAARGGGPLALSAPLGGLYKILQANPSVALRRLSYDAGGTMTVQLASPRIEDVNAVLIALQKDGFTITAQPMQGSDGMQMGIVTIRAVP